MRDYFKCLRLNTRPMHQVMAPLPKSRLMPFKPPFTFSGVYFLGPLMVKWGLATAKRCRGMSVHVLNHACWISRSGTFTWKTDDFFMILRQFISRRGPPEEIRSDRGTHFVGEDIEMRDTIEHLESVKQRSRWSYNKRESNGHLLLSPASPYMAGIRERLVRSRGSISRPLLVIDC